MTTLDELFPPADLKAEIDGGYVMRKQHPTPPLSIYTYSRACQYDRQWNAITMRCRGLVADDSTGEIVAWPFEKFFNTSEHDGGWPYAPPLPDEPFEIFDKLDGSLGIVFHFDGAWRVASKGSFISEQAQWGQQWIDARDTSALIPGLTYLAEILYPENRIVVRYDTRDLTLLAVYNGQGREQPLTDHADAWRALGGSVARSWNALPLAELVKLASENTKLDGSAATGTDAEGWVIRFASGVRAKAKIAEYVRLHKALTGTNARDVWQYLGAEKFGHLPAKALAQTIGVSAAEAERLTVIPGGALSSLLENVPDEFDAWVRSTSAELNLAAESIGARIRYLHARMLPLSPTRADFARLAQQESESAVRSGLFLALDDKDLGPHCWKAVRPGPSTPFVTDEEG